MNGLLPTRGSVMLDFVFIAMFAIVPLMGVGVWLAKQGRYQQHKWLQIGMGVVLLLAVIAFEVDIRLNGWRHLAEGSPYWTNEGWNVVYYTLYIHLCFAVPTPFLWIWVIVQALRKFPNPAAPSAHSHSHKKIAWASIIGMTLTAVTGWVFYYLAFIA